MFKIICAWCENTFEVKDENANFSCPKCGEIYNNGVSEQEKVDEEFWNWMP